MYLPSESKIIALKDIPHTVNCGVLGKIDPIHLIGNHSASGNENTEYVL
jgi:hypothetical protein